MAVQRDGVVQNDAVRASMTTIAPGDAQVPVKSDDGAATPETEGKEDKSKDGEKESEGGFTYFLVSRDMATGSMCDN